MGLIPRVLGGGSLGMVLADISGKGALSRGCAENTRQTPSLGHGSELSLFSQL